MNRTTVRSGAAIGLLVAALSLPPGSAVAEDAEPRLSPMAAPVQHDGSPDSSDEEIAAATAADAATIATQEGRSVAEVQEDLEWQDSAQAEIDRVAALAPEAFAGSSLSVADRTVWVGFTGTAPSTDTRFPEGTSATIQGDLPLNHEGRVQAARAAASAVEAEFGAEAVSRVDALTGIAEVFVATSRPSGSDARLARAERQAISEITVYFDPNSRGGEETVNGGGRLERVGTTSLLCTSAFTVVRNGTRGMTTAQHCPLPFTHENYDNATEHQAAHNASHYGGRR